MVLSHTFILTPNIGYTYVEQSKLYLFCWKARHIQQRDVTGRRQWIYVTSDLCLNPPPLFFASPFTNITKPSLTKFCCAECIQRVVQQRSKATDMKTIIFSARLLAGYPGRFSERINERKMWNRFAVNPLVLDF